METRQGYVCRLIEAPSDILLLTQDMAFMGVNKAFTLFGVLMMKKCLIRQGQNMKNRITECICALNFGRYLY